MQASAELNGFIEYVISEKLDGLRQIKLTRSQLVKLIREFSDRTGNSKDPILTLENWEGAFTSQIVHGDYVFRYSPFTESFTVQWLPTWENIGWAAETRKGGLRDEIRETVRQLTFDEFERLMKRVFEGVPWAKDIRVTKSTRDDGIDFLGRFVEKDSHLELPLLGQAKHWKGKVGSEQIRTFLGSIALKKRASLTVGVYVSTGGYTQAAWEAMRSAPTRIIPYDLDEFVDLLLRNKIGVAKTMISGLVLDQGFWTDVRA